MNAPLPSHALPPAEARPVPEAMLHALKARFGERCATALAVREQHGRDESPFDVPPPELVVFCESTEDVAFVVRQADLHAVPVIPFGVGSSLEGHLLAVQGGVSIDLGRMNAIVSLEPDDLTWGDRQPRRRVNRLQIVDGLTRCHQRVDPRLRRWARTLAKSVGQCAQGLAVTNPAYRGVWAAPAGRR